MFKRKKVTHCHSLCAAYDCRNLSFLHYIIVQAIIIIIIIIIIIYLFIYLFITPKQQTVPEQKGTHAIQ